MRRNRQLVQPLAVAQIDHVNVQQQIAHRCGATCSHCDSPQRIQENGKPAFLGVSLVTDPVEEFD